MPGAPSSQEPLVASLLLVAMPGAPSSLFLVVRPGAPSGVLAPIVAMSGPSSFLFLVVASLLLVAMPGAPSSFLFLVVRLGAPSPSSDARSPK